MDRLVTPPTRVTSPTWGLPPPCKQAPTHCYPSSSKCHCYFATVKDFKTLISYTIILTEVHASCFEESHVIWAIAAEQRKRRPICHNHSGDKASHKKAT